MASLTLLRPICLVLSALAVIGGGLGMLFSFVALGSSNMPDITAGASGFVAGAILIGAGILSLTMLAPRPSGSGVKEHGYPDLA